MPLHRKHKRVAGQLHRLDHAVDVPRADHQSLPHFVDGLMVVARHIGGIAEQRRRPGSRHGAHRQSAEHAVAGTMTGVAENLGQILVQRAAEGDVEHLRATADAQHRQSSVQRGPQQRELPGVAVGARLIGGRVRLLAVGGGVEVVTAGDHQRVQAVEQPVDRAGVHRLRRQQHRDTTGKDHALEVVGGQIGRRDVPYAGPHLLADTSSGPRPARHYLA